MQALPLLGRIALWQHGVAPLGGGGGRGSLNQPRAKRVQMRRLLLGQVAEAAAGHRTVMCLPTVSADRSAGSGRGL